MTRHMQALTCASGSPLGVVSLSPQPYLSRPSPPSTPTQVGCALQQHFQGQAAELVAAAQQSAVRLVQLITAHLPGFRDHAIYDGRQVGLAMQPATALLPWQGTLQYCMQQSSKA